MAQFSIFSLLLDDNLSPHVLLLRLCRRDYVLHALIKLGLTNQGKPRRAIRHEHPITIGQTNGDIGNMVSYSHKNMKSKVGEG